MIFYLLLDSNRLLIGQIGRKVNLEDGDIKMEISEGRDAASGGYRVTIKWEGPRDKVFEDCYDFGNFT